MSAAPHTAPIPLHTTPKWLLPAIVFGMVLGALTGGIAETEFAFITLLGDLFLNALKMMIIPLIISSIITGVTAHGDIRKLGKMGAVTTAYYLFTTVVAVVIGIVTVNLIRPGNGIALPVTAAPTVSDYSFLDVVRGIIPANLFSAMANGDILPIIFFSLFFGIVLSTLPQKTATLRQAIDGLLHVSMKMVQLIIYAAPIGVFALVATRVGNAGGFVAFQKELLSIGGYVVTVLAGLLVHGVVVLGLLAWFGGRQSPLAVVKKLAEPLLLAFSTSSSSATLPVTLNTVEQHLNVDNRVASFVLPLGATVNMDGTALYEAVAAIFVAQCYGIELSLSAQVLIVLTATLAAIGAAGIPQAGLVTLVMVMQTAGLPVEGIGIILAVDWLLDRCRTTVNVLGDAVGALVIARLLNMPTPSPTSPVQPTP